MLMTGVEFLWGKRTDNDGETGTDTAPAVQLQMVVLEQEHLGHVRMMAALRRGRLRRGSLG